MPDMPTSGMPELPPSDYANMSTKDVESAIRDLHLIIKKEKEGCQIPAIFGRNPYLKQLRENLKAAEAELESRPDADWSAAIDPDIQLGVPSTFGQWFRPPVVGAVVLAGVVALAGVSEFAFNFPINLRGNGTNGNTPNVLVATELPTKDEVCGIPTRETLDPILAPLTPPAGNPTKESSYVRCEYVGGTVTDPGYTDLIVTFSLYDPSKPLDTSKLQAVPDLGDDAFFTGPSKFDNFTLTSHKSKLIVKTYLGKKESSDDALRQEKAMQKQVYDWFKNNGTYKNLVG